MSMLDSTPVFKSRMLTLGVKSEYVQLFIDKGIDTLARLAYASASQPGTGDETQFIEVVAAALNIPNSADIPMGELSSIRRCWFEAHTVAVSEIRSRVERTEGSEPLRMPVPERELRLREQQSRLSGIAITANLEPSHQLVDFVNQLRSDEILKYIDPSKCTSREQEIRGVKKESFLKQSADGTVKVVQQEEKLEADLNGEFRIRIALQRRSLAMDLVKLARYQAIESYHDYLFQLLMSDVPDTHDRISLQQIIKADKSVFTKMTELCRAGIAQRPDGSYPVEEALKDAMRDPIVLASLSPLPRSARPAKINRQEEYGYRGAQPYQNNKGGGKPAKGRGRGGKGGKGGKDRQSQNFQVPKELEGLRTRTNKGQNICFSANMECGCQNAKWGELCYKGLHVCMKCGGGGHGASSCPKK